MYIRTYVFILLSLGAFVSRAQFATAFFLDETPLKLTLTYDMRKLGREKMEDKAFPAHFECQYTDSTRFSSSVELIPRGVMRRKYCFLPPLFVNFKSSPDKQLAALGRIKLVTHCRMQPDFQNYVAKEYLIYKAYNLLTEKSFKVRFAIITYRDSLGKEKPTEGYGFFIEDVDKMAKRNDCIEYDNKQIQTESTDREQMTMVALFQYMIGNTDWSVPGLHNMKLIMPAKPSAHAVPIAVPYDFDYAGLIDAPYALPAEALNISSVRERIYRGFCRRPEEIDPIIDLFLQKEARIMDLFASTPLLSAREKAFDAKYLTDYFDMIRDKDNAIRRFSVNCRTE